MVATVKIIPFAAPAGRWSSSCVRDRGRGGPLVAVAPYRHLDVALIQTRLPSVKESVLDKTVAITADRISASGGRLVSEARCAHDDRRRWPSGIRASSGDLLLIAGASAITDRADVLPAAIEAAGGAVEHFGMPVDPGNLLLLARLGERPVLGPARLLPLAQAERLRLGAAADRRGHRGHAAPTSWAWAWAAS